MNTPSHPVKRCRCNHDCGHSDTCPVRICARLSVYRNLSKLLGRFIVGYAVLIALAIGFTLAFGA